jgi:hypothetical protein
MRRDLQKLLVLLLVLAICVLVQSRRAHASCTHSKVNLQGSSNGSITIDATAGGILVMAAATAKRCGATIQNSGSAAMRCGPASMTVSATAGYLISAGASLNVGPEGQEAWNCIRTTASSTTADVDEAVP